jgi:peptidoglycan hydrolase-like protein with peptidoglycan-binding domain
MKRTLVTVACALTVIMGLSVASGNKKIGIFSVDTVSAATGEAEPAAPAPSAPAPKAASAASAQPTTYAPATSINRFLSFESYGEDVKLVQTSLKNSGYNLVVDGIFGKNTEAALKDYQSKNGLAADGVVGPKTIAKLIPPTPAPQPAPAAPTAPVAALNATKLYQGLGQTIAFRNGPGKDSTGVPVYSFTIVMADATFDADGRIVNSFIDSYEVSTPNYDGASMPHFSGWPGKEGYNVTDHETEKVTGVSVNTLESATAEVTGWKTKRERGDAYGMNPKNDWYKQMDHFQKFFVGKTVAELEAWFKKNTTAAGRPIKANSTNAQDLEKLAKLNDAEKAVLADVVSGATMSLRDPHGDFITALANAYKNRVEMAIPNK